MSIYIYRTPNWYQQIKTIINFSQYSLGMGRQMHSFPWANTNQYLFRISMPVVCTLITHFYVCCIYFFHFFALSFSRFAIYWLCVRVRACTRAHTHTLLQALQHMPSAPHSALRLLDQRPLTHAWEGPESRGLN